MEKQKLSRRRVITTLALGAGAASLPLASCKNPDSETTGYKQTSFRYCLNTSTISGQKPGLLESIQFAGAAGYDGIEVWIRDVQAFLEGGGSTGDIRKALEDQGIRVESAIGFAPWMTGGEAGIQQMKDEMNMLAEIGCKRIAAPPAGVPADEALDLFQTGKKYKELLDLGRRTGVMPQLEFWGSSPSLWHLGQVLMIAAVANDPDTRILPDVYHLYRGGSGFHGLKMLDGSLIDIFHLNDYPEDKAREEQTDADRVYPGDGAAPLEAIMQNLSDMGGAMVLSLELFNRSYWKQDPLDVAKKGLEKMKALTSL